MKNVRFTYRGRAWVAYIAPEAEVGQLAEDENCPAFVETTHREIYFSDNYELNLTNVLHELWHMAVQNCYVSSINLAQHESEEFSAELFAHEGEEVLQLGKKLLKALIKLKDLSTDAEINLDEKSN